VAPKARRPTVLHQPSPWERLIDDYLAHCRAGGLSPRTLDHYGSVLRTVLLRFAEERELAGPGALDQRMLDRLANQLLDRGGARGPLSKHSVHSYLRAINHFLKWAHSEGEFGELKARTPKLPRGLVEVLNDQEIDALERAAQQERDKLIVLLLADHGLRVGELLGLRTRDLIEQGRERYLRIHGKGGRDRLVPVPKIYRRLRTYVDRYRPADARTDHIFLGLHRRPSGEYEPLTKSGLEQLLRLLGQQAGLQKRVYPHLLRHSYATRALRRGMNPLQLQEILGHTTLEMISRVYSHLTPSDAHEAQLRFLRGE
jgi:integrase/recombinase XerD